MLSHSVGSQDFSYQVSQYPSIFGSPTSYSIFCSLWLQQPFLVPLHHCRTVTHHLVSITRSGCVVTTRVHQDSHKQTPMPIFVQTPTAWRTGRSTDQYAGQSHKDRNKWWKISLAAQSGCCVQAPGVQSVRQWACHASTELDLDLISNGQNPSSSVGTFTCNTNPTHTVYLCDTFITLYGEEMCWCQQKTHVELPFVWTSCGDYKIMLINTKMWVANT